MPQTEVPATPSAIESIPESFESVEALPSVGMTSPSVSPPASQYHDESDNEWHDLLPKLALSGMTSQLAQHCLLDHISENEVNLHLDNTGVTLKSERTEQQLSEALSAHLGRTVRAVLHLSDLREETPERRRVRVREELQQFAEDAIANDAFVQQMQRLWGTTVIPGSVQPYVDE